MTIEDALNINPATASIKELKKATDKLRRSYNASKTAFERRHRTSYLMELMKNRQKAGTFNPKLNINKASRQDIEELFSSLRDYKGTAVYDPKTDKLVGYTESKTSTFAGYEKYQKNIAEKVLGYDDYRKLSYEEQTKIWEYIDDIRNSRRSYFTKRNGVYGSDVNIKKLVEWYNAGYTREQAINLLEGNTTIAKLEEEEARAALVELNPPGFDNF